MRTDTGQISYRGENTAPDCTEDCRDAGCDQHYVVRLDGRWWRAFHNEQDARIFVEDAERLTNR
jgi:hypothetical protein